MSSTTQIKNGNTQQNYVKKPMTNNGTADNKAFGGVNKVFNKKPEDDKATSNRKVFVGGLTPNTTKDNLVEYFSKYGGVEEASIKMDLTTNRSKGYGFVLFESKEVADAVLGASEHTIMGKTVDVKTAKYKGVTPVKKVFIGGLDPNFPETELREYFSTFGKIEEIELPFDKQKNQRRSFCFILYESEDSVNEVLKKSKHVLGGKEVDVKKATPPKDANQQNALLQPQWNQMQNWNMGGNYFPDPSQAYGASNFGGPGLYSAPGGSYAGQSSGYNQAAGYNKYNYQQSQMGNYPANYGENFDAGYVDYDDPNSYDYTSGNLQAYDQSGFYQGGQVNAQYGDYYDQNLYGNYNEQFNPAAAPVAPPASSKSHHSYGKVSKRSSSQSYHPYNR